MTAAPTVPPSRHPLLTPFVDAVVVAGTGVLAYAALQVPALPDPWGWALLSLLAVVATSFALKVPGVPVFLSISDAFFLTAGLLYGAEAAALTIAIDSLIVSMRRRGRGRQLLFNATSPAFALWCSVHAYAWLADTGGVDTITPRSVIALAAMAGTYFLLNSGLTATAAALSKGRSPLRFWIDHCAMLAVNVFASASAACVLVLSVRQIGLAALALATPALLVCYLAVRSWFGRLEDAQQHLADVHRLHLSTIEAFSTAIEAKDGVTSDHIHRVQAYAMGLARVLGVTDAETLKALEAAALLHDTGKLAIPEHILNKPGKLTAQEFETMKAHVDIGADILSTIDFPFPVVPIVRAHHEHWNGTGYPRGLSGHDIPIGARILSVVDCFDALTSDRPYRPALAESAALEIIQKGRGTQYDPEVVDAFARSYRELAPTSLPQPRLEALLASMRSTAAAPAAGLAPSPVPVPAGPAAPTSELLAFVSLARLASGTPTLADVGALADGHLRQLAPGATIALFGLDASGTAVTAHFTAGPAAECVNGVSMRLGERLTGWVAANMRSMANADPRLDLGAGTPSGLRHATATPLVVDGELTGALTVYGAEPLTDDQSRTLDMIAPQLAVAVAAIQRGAAQAPALRPAMRVVAGGRSR